MIRFRIVELLEEQSTPERRLTLYWLAQEARVTYPAIHRMAKKKVKQVDLDIVEKICDALGCELGELMVRVKEPSQKRS